MNDLVKQDIFNLFHSGMGTDEIAMSMCVDEQVVKDCIAENGKELVASNMSPAAVTQMVKQGRCIVTDEDYEHIISGLVDIAKFSDNDSARLKAIEKIIDEKTGRAEEKHMAELIRATKGVGGGDMFMDIDERLAKAKKIKEASLKGNVIDIVEPAISNE